MKSKYFKEHYNNFLIYCFELKIWTSKNWHKLSQNQHLPGQLLTHYYGFSLLVCRRYHKNLVNYQVSIESLGIDGSCLCNLTEEDFRE